MPFTDIDFRDQSPENQQRILQILNANKFKKNVMELSEFTTKYMVLFRKDLLESKPQYVVETAIRDYFARIDQFRPVYVVRSLAARTVEELLSPSNLVYTLPPIFSTLNPVNAAGEGGVNAMQAFTNLATLNLEDTFGHKQKAFGERVKAVIDAVNPQFRLEEARRKAAALADKVPGVREAKTGVIDATAEVIQDLETVQPMNSNDGSTTQIVSKEVPL